MHLWGALAMTEIIGQAICFTVQTQAVHVKFRRHGRCAGGALGAQAHLAGRHLSDVLRGSMLSSSPSPASPGRPGPGSRSSVRDQWMGHSGVTGGPGAMYVLHCPKMQACPETLVCPSQDQGNLLWSIRQAVFVGHTACVLHWKVSFILGQFPAQTAGQFAHLMMACDQTRPMVPEVECSPGERHGHEEEHVPAARDERAVEHLCWHPVNPAHAQRPPPVS